MSVAREKDQNPIICSYIRGIREKQKFLHYIFASCLSIEKDSHAVCRKSKLLNKNFRKRACVIGRMQ